MKTTAFLTCASAALLASSANAQVASTLLREGDALTGPLAGQTVSSISGASANNNGGYASGFNSSGASTLSHIFATPDGTAPGVIQTEGMIGPLTQTAFEGAVGMSNAGPASYSATCDGAVVTSADSVWFGNTPVAVEGDPHPTLAGQFWRFASRPGCTGDGQPHFVGGITSTQGGSTENRGLFLGLDGGTVLALGGDVVPNLPEPLTTGSSVSFDYRVSTLGTNYIYEAGMAGASVGTSNDNAIVLSGSGLVLGGTLVQEGNLIPMSVGGDGVENWDNFDYLGITESGDYLITGDTDGSTATDEILVVNGQILYREGGVIDGKLIEGSIEGASMNESGDIAFIWDWDDNGNSREALFYNDTFLLAEGDEVDWDGDGNVDPGFTIVSFTGSNSMSLGNDSTIYFTADIDVMGTTLEGLFAYAVPTEYPTFCFGDTAGSVCPCGNQGNPGEGCANSTGSGMLASASGDAVVGADTLVFTAIQCPAGVPGVFFQGNSALGSPGFLGDGLLCISGGIQRLGVTFVDASGVVASNPMISVLGGVSPGDTRYYQFWARDNAGPCGQGSNTSNAIQVDWQ